MKHIIRKAYWNYEKEEKWLNEMSSKGMALTDYSWCRYVFEEEKQGEYVYRIELLEHSVKHPESKAYIEFLETEMGVECVATYMRWIYLRKKSTEGAFEIYTDIDSEIAHYKRILNLWTVLMWLELTIGFFNILCWFMNRNSFHPANTNLYCGMIVFVLGICFYQLIIPLRKKVKVLKKRKLLME